MLATANGGSRSYADDAAVRTACYQAVGDYTGNIGTGALKAFSKQLSGYNPITGTYATDGHTVALTLDSSLCVTAYEALAGRKGAVLVSNYKTGEILCMASGPSIDPSSDGDVPDGAYINRCINGSFTPGSIFKLITSAAAIENIKDIDSRRFTCAGSVDVAGVTVKCKLLQLRVRADLARARGGHHRELRQEVRLPRFPVAERHPDDGRQLHEGRVRQREPRLVGHRPV